MIRPLGSMVVKPISRCIGTYLQQGHICKLPTPSGKVAHLLVSWRDTESSGRSYEGFHRT